MKYRFIAGLLVVLAAGCTYALLNIVLSAPQRTPLFIFAADYDLPWIQPSNSNRVPSTVQLLHRRNLQCEQFSGENSFNESDWIEIEATISRYDSQTRHDVPLLFLISLQGVVANDGQPYLLVSHSVPNNTETWLSLKELFNRVSRSVSKNRNLVFFFPQGTMPHHLSTWKTDSFSSAVKSMLDRMKQEMQINRIACLVEDGANDSNICSLAGESALTHAIAQGLNGKADRDTIASDRDNVVEWQELQSYVQAVYSKRILATRGCQASTTSIVHGTPPSLIAWALTDPPKEIAVPLPSGDVQEELEASWIRFESLRSQRPWLTYPVAWSQLRLLALAAETDLFSGNSERAKQQMVDFHRLADSIDVRTRGALRPLAKDRDREIAKRFAVQWRTVATQNVDSWQSFCEQLRLVAPDESSLDPMLYYLIRSPQLGLWGQRNLLQKFASQRETMERHREESIDLPEDLKLLSLEVRMLEACRRLQDRILANQPVSDLTPLQKDFVERSDSYQARYRQLLAKTSEDVETARELPRLCLAIDALGLCGSAISDLKSMQSLAMDCIRDVANQGFAHEPMSASEISDEDGHVTKLSKLQSYVYKAWENVLKAEESKPLSPIQLDRLLMSGATVSPSDSPRAGITLRLKTLQSLAALDRSQGRSRFSADPTQLMPGKLWNEWESTVTTSLLGETDAPSANRSILLAHSRQSLWLDPVATRWIDQSAAQLRRSRLERSAVNVLDDFWQCGELDQEPYFAIEAERLLKGAETISEAESDGASLAEVRARLEKRRKAATDPFEFPIDWKLRSTTKPVPEWGCLVQRTTPGEGLPFGDAFAPSPAKNTTPKLISIGPNMSAQSLGIIAESQADSWTPMLMFRGRQYQGGAFQQNASTVSTATFERDQRTSLIVYDERKQHRARTIILDCSASMSEKVLTEGVGSSGQPEIGPSTRASSVTKLDAARVALRQVLEQWRGREDWVGFTIFGHRVASSPDSKNLIQVKYLAAFPFQQNQQAYDDVESILSVGRFGDSEFASVMDHLNKLVPWGQTPLYVAILDALERSRTLDPSVPHDIVVVSDGRNYQFNPPPERNISLDQIIDLAREQSTRIHIIGFGIPADESLDAAQQYQRLASETGGSVVMQVADAMTLVQNLKAHATPQQYQLRVAGGETFLAQANQEVQLPSTIGLNTPLTIEYSGDKRVIPLNVGSAIQLRSESGRLVSTGYSGRPVEVRTPLIDRLGRATSFVLVSARPKVEQRSINWEFSLERTDGDIPQRPGNVLLEIEPTRDGVPLNPGQSRWIFASSEANWKSQASVPTMSLRTENWPSEATEAEVRFWCADSEWEAIETIAGTNSTEGVVPGLGFRYKVLVDDQGVAVSIQDMDKGIALHDIYPRIVSDRAISTIERRLYHAPSIALHRFLWEPGSYRESNRSSVRIQFCHAPSLREVGLRPISSIRLPMPHRFSGQGAGHRESSGVR